MRAASSGPPLYGNRVPKLESPILRRHLSLEQTNSVGARPNDGSTGDAGSHCGPERAVLYAAALQTGPSAVELRKLCCRNLDLDAQPATLTVRASVSKNRKRAIKPIRQDLDTKWWGRGESNPHGPKPFGF